MKICAIICEYNPLHNGHIAHIQKTKELTGCDTLLLVMSGNFVQRGEPAMINKFDRSRLAIQAGADIVLELPLTYSIAGAERFAAGAIKILNAIPAVTHLSFGSEHGNVKLLNTLAKFLANEPSEFKSRLNEFLRMGNNLATSRTAAVMQCINKGAVKVQNKEEAREALYAPNSILGIEYLKALIRQGSKITPVTVKREGSQHNSNEIGFTQSSGSAIRNACICGNLEDVRSSVPAFVFDFIERYRARNKLSMTALGDMILYKIRCMSAEEIGELYDVSEGLNNRIKKYANYAVSYESLLDTVKTKRYTAARLRRIFLYSILSVTKKAVSKIDKLPAYAKVLALKKGREDILSRICDPKNITLLTRAEDYKAIADTPLESALAMDMLSTDLYALLNSDPILRIGGQDLSSGINYVSVTE